MSAVEENPVIPAATVVIFRNAKTGGPPEILMVTRSRQLSFAGGMAVFPGGRVDDADTALAKRLDHELPEDEAASRIAAMRETLEETGLAIAVREAVTAPQAAEARALLLDHIELAPVLDRMGWTLDLDALVPFARWLPHLHLSRTFDTRFYLADLGTGAVDVAVDQTENTRLFWSSAADTLAAAERGEVSVIYPTRRNLERLAQFGDFAAATADAKAHPVRTITPEIVEENGQRRLIIPDDSGYPVTSEPFTSVQRG